MKPGKGLVHLHSTEHTEHTDRTEYSIRIAFATLTDANLDYVLAEFEELVTTARFSLKIQGSCGTRVIQCFT